MESKLDREKFVKHLNEKWKGEKICPICGVNNWNLPEHVQEIRAFFGGGLFLGAPVYPVACITCNNCGHVLFFNALTADVLLKPTEPPAPSSPPPDHPKEGE